jgi:hypothetical protein
MPLFALSMAALASSAMWATAAGSRDSRHSWCGTYPGRAASALYEHREQEGRLGRPVRAASDRIVVADASQVAVLKDDGDLILLRNFFDLQGAGLEFRTGSDSASVARVDRPVAADGGTRLSLTDDSTVSVALPFSFPYYGQAYTQLFVNSDGNLTFGAGDNASTDRGIGRLVTGPPRIAPLFADLNPEAGGNVTTAGDASRFSVTWTDVPQYGQSDKNTFQVTLYPDGRIAFAYDKNVSSLIDAGAIGVAPGASKGGLTSVDFATTGGASTAGALAENFHAEDELDPVAVTRKFYLGHPDDYQQIIVFTSRPLRSKDYYAYELTIQNTDSGIGQDPSNAAADYGSAGRLESFVTMDFVLKYPDDPFQLTLGTNNTLSIMGQEAGHRWGAYARFRDGASNSDELLGRDNAHWSFFLDSDASHMEGNDIADLGGGQFRTVAATQRYSPLDQYLMGLRPAAEVPPFFFVRSPTSPSGGPAPDRADAPKVDVSFNGTRRDVTIDDVIAALGPRNPPPGPRPPWRQIFVYIDAGLTDPAVALAKIDRIRTAWETFFAQSTDGRRTVDTHLN